VIEALLYPINWFIERPYLAVFPALIFGLCFFGLRHSSSAAPRRNALAASILWLVYAIYEWRMQVWSETVSNPIRVDLMVIAPILYAGTAGGLFGLVVCFRFARTRKELRRRLLIGLGAILLLLTACVAGEYLFITRPSDEEDGQRNSLSQVAYDLGVPREEHGAYPRDLNELVVAGFPQVRLRRCSGSSATHLMAPASPCHALASIRGS